MFTHLSARPLAIVSCVVTAIQFAVPALAQDTDVAKQLSNPLASMISVPFQLNNDDGYGFGSTDGVQTRLNIQPVIPFAIGENLNLITRTVIPYIWQKDAAIESNNTEGWGDSTMSFWLGPATPTHGVTWGVGPVLYLPTSSSDALGVGEWGGGITVVALAQPGAWTIGGLANHIWSFESGAINATYLQPFISYNTPNAWTFSVNTESTYDWNSDQWTIPFNFTVAKLVSIGEQKVSLQAGARYYADAADSGPQGWGARLAATFVFPKK